MRRVTFSVDGPDALMAMDAALTFAAVADYQPFMPKYDEQISKLIVFLDVPIREERCAEEALLRTLHLVRSRHTAQVAPEPLRKHDPR